MKKQKSLTIYIGWDSREPIAADVCKHSILEHASIPVNIVYLKQEELRKQGIYFRDVDNLGSTEFTFTRFLVPYLNNYDEFAVFVDCDFVFFRRCSRNVKISRYQKSSASGSARLHSSKRCKNGRQRTTALSKKKLEQYDTVELCSQRQSHS